MEQDSYTSRACHIHSGSIVVHFLPCLRPTGYTKLSNWSMCGCRVTNWSESGHVKVTCLIPVAAMWSAAVSLSKTLNSYVITVWNLPLYLFQTICSVAFFRLMMITSSTIWPCWMEYSKLCRLMSLCRFNTAESLRCRAVIVGMSVMSSPSECEDMLYPRWLDKLNIKGVKWWMQIHFGICFNLMKLLMIV